MADGFKIIDSDVEVATMGIMRQAEAHGLDLTDSKIKAFLEHMIKVRSADRCRERNLQNMLHEYSFEGK